MTNPFVDGAVNVPHEPALHQPSGWGFDSAGSNDNFEGTDHATIDRHII